MKNAVNTLSVAVILFILSDLVWSSPLSSKAPISVDRLTVVIIEETESRQSLPSSQLSAINSQVWRDYVSEHNGQWRVLDQHTDVSGDETWVKQSLKSERGGLPWLIFANKKSGGSIHLPKNLEHLMEKIKQ